jgi:hypothetical protein
LDMALDGLPLCATVLAMHSYQSPCASLSSQPVISRNKDNRRKSFG